MGTAEHQRKHFVLSETIFSAARPATEVTVLIWQSAAGLHGQVEALASSSFSCSCAAATSGTAVRHGHTAGGGVRGRAAAAGARAGAPSCTLQTMFCSRMQSAAGDARAAITDRIDQAAAGRAQPTRKAAPSRRDTLVFYGVSTEPRWDSIPLVHHRARAHAPAERPPSPANTQPGRHPQLVLVLLQRRS